MPQFGCIYKPYYKPIYNWLSILLAHATILSRHIDETASKCHLSKKLPLSQQEER